MSTSRFVNFLALSVVLMACASAQTCNNVSYWLEEGQILSVSLLSPPNVGSTFHDTGFGATATTQNPAIQSCSNYSFTYFTTPSTHTITPNGFVPVVPAFSVNSSTGAFVYANLPMYGQAHVWNGFDHFDFNVTCYDTVVPTVCTRRAFINVIYTSAATKNQTSAPFTSLYQSNFFLNCTGNCRNKTTDGMWLARQTLPRIWDMQQDEFGNNVKPTVTLPALGAVATDGLTFQWTSNFAIVNTFGAISSMSARFPTFEIVEFQPGQNFTGDELANSVAIKSTGFNQSCLNLQTVDGNGSDVFVFHNNNQDGALGSKYNSGDSWYQKFGGKHAGCDVFTNNPCKYAPLLTPRRDQDESTEGVWKVAIRDCTVQWTGKFTWNAMRAQTLHNTNLAWNIDDSNGAYTITSEIYNQAVQPNSWTSYSRGFVELDHKYLLKVVLAQDTDFQFTLGIDIFTVDLQQYRYFDSNGDYAFGYNMIVYPKALNEINQQNPPDRRITGFKWVEHTWLAPNELQCPLCGNGSPDTAFGRSKTDTNGNLYQYTTACTDSSTTYTGAFADGNCPSATGIILLKKGPAAACTNTDVMVINGEPGISGQNPTSGACQTTYQNITLRGVAVGSGSNATVFNSALAAQGFGFEGKITLTFQLGNGEHPHFVIQPKLYVKSISIDGSFAGTSSTCRGSPYWPVNDSNVLPQYLCEEVDARTFGPTDWAIILFDIKDVNPEDIELRGLYITVNGLSVRFYPSNGSTGTWYTPQYDYLNFRDLKSWGDLHNVSDVLPSPTAPSGVQPPQNSDYGFAFTPGAHNENAKITIYCTLRILNNNRRALKHRFGSAAAPSAENNIQENINIQNGYNTQLSSLSSGDRVVEGRTNTGAVADSSASSTSSSNSAAVIGLAAACAVLLAAVVGMVLYVVRLHSANAAPKRVASTA